VYWFSTKKKKWVRKRFGTDLNTALKFFQERDYPGKTLHSDNRAYPPPPRITHHETEEWKVVSRKGRKYKKKVKRVVNLMSEYNLKGVWWCPFCIQLRRFKFVETEYGPEMFCPVCTASHRIVKNYNPNAVVIERDYKPRRTSRVKPRRRRRRA